MPLRFYRRFRAGPFRLNVSKRGVSYSVGGRGAWWTLGRGRVRTSVGLPGSGLYWYQQRRLPRPASAPIPVNPKMERRAMPWRTLPPPTPVQWIAIAGMIGVIALTGWAVLA